MSGFRVSDEFGIEACSRLTPATWISAIFERLENASSWLHQESTIKAVDGENDRIITGPPSMVDRASVMRALTPQSNCECYLTVLSGDRPLSVPLLISATAPGSVLTASLYGSEMFAGSAPSLIGLERIRDFCARILFVKGVRCLCFGIEGDLDLRSVIFLSFTRERWNRFEGRVKKELGEISCVGDEVVSVWGELSGNVVAMTPGMKDASRRVVEAVMSPNDPKIQHPFSKNPHQG